VLPATRLLRDMLHTTWRLPLAAAVEVVLEESGFLALAATTPGGARAGHLLQAVDRVREVVEEGGGLADAADALNEEEESSEAEALPLRPGRPDVVRLMNLHKAKGLEAPVVFLADPGHAADHPPTWRIARDGAKATGHLKIEKKGENARRAKTLGEPAGWAAHEQEERRYKDAEKLRLLYVAGTRARDLLVVSRLDDPKKNKAWGEFESYLAKVPELKTHKAKPDAKRARPDLSAATRAKAAAARTARHERANEPSWAVVTPTGARTRQEAAVATAAVSAGGARTCRARHGQPARGRRCGLGHPRARSARARHAVPGRHARRPRPARAVAHRRIAEAASLHLRGGSTWSSRVEGTVLARRRGAGGRDLRRGAVRRAPRAGAGRARRGCGGPAHRPARHHRPRARRRGGWHIVDYKTDQLDGVADVEAELLRGTAHSWASTSSRGNGSREGTSSRRESCRSA